MTAPRIERVDDIEQALLTVLAGHQATVWTCLPAIITKVDLDKMTCEAQPTIRIRVRDYNQNYSWITMPICVDCPLVFPSGGGYTLTFPVAIGDECLLHFANRCIDAWWQSGGVQQPPEIRMHDLSDGFAQVGPRSQPRKLSPPPSSSGVELRTDDGSASIKISGDTITLNAAHIVITGELTNNGKQVGSGIKVKGVATGGGTSSGVV